MEDGHSVVQQAFLLAIIHLGPPHARSQKEKLKINISDNFSLKACTWSGDCCRGIRLAGQWSQIKQVLLSPKPMLLLPPACVNPPTPLRVLAFFISICLIISQWWFWNFSPVPRVSLLTCSLHQSCGGWALSLRAQLWLTKGKSSSHLCTFGKVLFFLAAAPPLSSSSLPTCLASSPSAVAKPAPSPKQPPLSPSPLGHPCLWVCPLPSLEAMFISVSPFLFVSHSTAWFIVGDSHA